MFKPKDGEEEGAAAATELLVRSARGGHSALVRSPVDGAASKPVRAQSLGILVSVARNAPLLQRLCHVTPVLRTAEIVGRFKIMVVLVERRTLGDVVKIVSWFLISFL